MKVMGKIMSKPRMRESIAIFCQFWHFQVIYLCPKCHKWGVLIEMKSTNKAGASGLCAIAQSRATSKTGGSKQWFKLLSGCFLYTVRFMTRTDIKWLKLQKVTANIIRFQIILYDA
ncbi:hypothetical protein NF634_002870 [Salmonella enterica]|nr:hypothetical protein [Salmonella enterica]